jgi:hypothetical protein
MKKHVIQVAAHPRPSDVTSSRNPPWSYPPWALHHALRCRRRRREQPGRKRSGERGYDERGDHVPRIDEPGRFARRRILRQLKVNATEWRAASADRGRQVFRIGPRLRSASQDHIV